VSDAGPSNLKRQSGIESRAICAINGPLKDNKGHVIATKENSFVENLMSRSKSMGYLVEVLIGSTSLIDLVAQAKSLRHCARSSL